MAEGSLNGRQQVRCRSVNTHDDNDSPLDFSVKRDHVTFMTSSQEAVTSLPVAAAPTPVLFRPLLEPSLMSALSAAGLLLRAPPPPTTSSSSSDVAAQVRAYVQAKIADEERRMTHLRTTSSSSADTSVDRTVSPARSSPTSTTTSAAGLDGLASLWTPSVVPPPSTTPEQSAGATSGGRKRASSVTDEPTSRDSHYWERRRKNNEAAKRSRDARRAKEEEVAVRASMLEQENRQLRIELTAFRLEVARLSELLCRQMAPQSTPPAATKSHDNNSPR